MKRTTGSLERFPRPFLDQPAPFEHDQLVGFTNRREPMRNDDGRSTTRGIHQRLLHELFGHGIEVRCRFIENQNGRITNDRPGDRDALALTARHHGAALADQRVEPLRQRGEDIRQVRHFDGPLNRIGRCPGEAVDDVLEEGAVEEKCVLLDKSGCAVPALRRVLPIVNPIHRHESRRRWPESQQDRGKSGFS